MPVTIQERQTGRRYSGRQASREYIIRGAASEPEARSELLASIPGTVGGFDRINDDCDIEEIAEGIYIGTGVWGVSGLQNQQPIDSFQISFDISGVQQRITQSRSTVNRYARPGKTAKDFKGAINVASDGTVEGTDIVIPCLSFQMTYTFAESAVNEAYIDTLTQVVGTVNSDSFKGLAAGTLLLTKVNGNKRSKVNETTQAVEWVWDITFGFSASRNETSLTVGDITGIEKKGWEYLWVYYEEVEDSTNKVVRKIPVSAYVEQVYTESNYSLLAI